jgi:uncharacterized membrane protein (DUF373 family)
LIEPPVFLLSISDILATFGAFLAVFIAIETFIIITLYIRNNVLPVKLVVATAAAVLVLGITYWLISKKPYL